MATEKIKQWIRSDILALGAYPVPNSEGFIKLDAMENPYTWPENLRLEWLDLLKNMDVNRYPDPDGTALKKSLREAMQIPDNMALLLGNGSDEIIQMIILALGGKGRKVLSVEPGFVMYKMIATFCQMEYIGIELNSTDFSLNKNKCLAEIKRHQPAVIFLAYPNNPTANLFDETIIDEIIETAEGLVVIDEAYAPFTQASYLTKLEHYNNLVVMRTVSKMGLAGLRLGILVGSKDWLDEFNKVRLPYNINSLTQMSAEFALKNQAIFDQQTNEIIASREILIKQLKQFKKWKIYPSETNFILIKVEAGRADLIFEYLKEQHILIKKSHGSHPLLVDCLRITVGTEKENKALLEALTSVA